MSTFVRSIALLVIALGGVSCLRSVDDITQDFNEVVAASNACTEVSECVLVIPGCPLGCFVAVNSAKKAEVEEKARELVEEYENEVAGFPCAYTCVAPDPLECVEGHCDFKAASP